MKKHAMPLAVPALLREIFEEEMAKLGLCLDDLRFTGPRLTAYSIVCSRLLSGELDRRLREEIFSKRGR